MRGHLAALAVGSGDSVNAAGAKVLVVGLAGWVGAGNADQCAAALLILAGDATGRACADVLGRDAKGEESDRQDGGELHGDRLLSWSSG